MIVDTPGFQNPEQGGAARGASFEELCHNYAQDRLQRLFHERTFVQELERYKEVALDLVSACHPQPPLALAPSGRASVDAERKAALLAAPSQLLLSCHVCWLSRLVDFSCRGCSLTLWRICSPRSYAFRVPGSPSLPTFKAPPRTCELPPCSCCLHVWWTWPSLSPYLLRW